MKKHIGRIEIYDSRLERFKTALIRVGVSVAHSPRWQAAGALSNRDLPSARWSIYTLCPHRHAPLIHNPRDDGEAASFFFFHCCSKKCVVFSKHTRCTQNPQSISILSRCLRGTLFSLDRETCTEETFTQITLSLYYNLRFIVVETRLVAAHITRAAGSAALSQMLYTFSI